MEGKNILRWLWKSWFWIRWMWTSRLWGPQKTRCFFLYWLTIDLKPIFKQHVGFKLSVFKQYFEILGCETIHIFSVHFGVSLMKITLQMALGSLLAWSNTRRRMRSQPTKRWPRSWKIPWSRMDLKGFKSSNHPFSGDMLVSGRVRVLPETNIWK